MTHDDLILFLENAGIAAGNGQQPSAVPTEAATVEPTPVPPLMAQQMEPRPLGRQQPSAAPPVTAQPPAAPDLQSARIAHLQSAVDRSNAPKAQGPWWKEALSSLATNYGKTPQELQFRQQSERQGRQDLAAQLQDALTQQRQGKMDERQMSQDKATEDYRAASLKQTGDYQTGELKDKAAQRGIQESAQKRLASQSAQSTAAKMKAAGFDPVMDPNTGEVMDWQVNEVGKRKQSEQDDLSELRAANRAKAEAETALIKAKNDPASPAYKAASQAHDDAMRRIALTSRRLDLSESQFEMRAFGTNDGAALPGSVIGEDGKPVGSNFQANVRPTNTERNKADMGLSAHEQIQDIKSIVQRRPDIFGPAAGRKTEFTVWLGSQDPDAQAFRAARTIAGDHLAATFGGRSETALKSLDDAIGQFKDNPAAVLAGLDQLEKANQVFIQKGTVHATGTGAPSSAAAPKPGATPTPAASGGNVVEYVKDAKGNYVPKPKAK